MLMLKNAWYGLCVLLLMACASAPDTDAMGAAELLVAGDKAVTAKHYPQANTYYGALRTRFPFGKEARQALLNSMYVNIKDNNPASALASAETFIHLYPRDPHVDYAYYMKGLANFGRDINFFERVFNVDIAARDLNHFKVSFRDFNTLVRLFPNSQYAADARLRMAFIRNALAEHTLQVANFYYERKTYVAAANRAQEVVLHYQGAPQVMRALQLLVKSYQAMDMGKQAQQSQQLLDQLHQKTGP
jgi:outer membrane protein assembly factor BamD